MLDLSRESLPAAPGVAQFSKCPRQWMLSKRSGLAPFRDRKGTPKILCDKDFAELSGELSGAICFKYPVLLGSALELFRQLFGTVRAIFWLWGSVLVPEPSHILLLLEWTQGPLL